MGDEYKGEGSDSRYPEGLRSLIVHCRKLVGYLAKDVKEELETQLKEILSPEKDCKAIEPALSKWLGRATKEAMTPSENKENHDNKITFSDTESRPIQAFCEAINRGDAFPDLRTLVDQFGLSVGNDTEALRAIFLQLLLSDRYALNSDKKKKTARSQLLHYLLEHLCPRDDKEKHKEAFWNNPNKEIPEKQVIEQQVRLELAEQKVDSGEISDKRIAELVAEKLVKQVVEQSMIAHLLRHGDEEMIDQCLAILLTNFCSDLEKCKYDSFQISIALAALIQMVGKEGNIVGKKGNIEEEKRVERDTKALNLLRTELCSRQRALPPGAPDLDRDRRKKAVTALLVLLKQDQDKFLDKHKAMRDTFEKMFKEMNEGLEGELMKRNSLVKEDHFDIFASLIAKERALICALTEPTSERKRDRLYEEVKEQCELIPGEGVAKARRRAWRTLYQCVGVLAVIGLIVGLSFVPSIAHFIGLSVIHRLAAIAGAIGTPLTAGAYPLIVWDRGREATIIEKSHPITRCTYTLFKAKKTRLTDAMDGPGVLAQAVEAAVPSVRAS